MIQHYRILSFTLVNGGTLNFRSLCMQFIPTSIDEAVVLAQIGSDLSPVRKICRTSLRIAEIRYTLSAWCDDRFKAVNFKHAVKHGLVYDCKANMLLPQSGRLFTRVALNVLLDSEKFSGVKGVQFVA